MRFDREHTFQLLQQRNWKALIELFKNNTVYGQIQEDEIAKAVLNAQFIRELIGGDSIKGKSKKREQIRHVHFTNLFYCSGTEYLMQFKDSR